MDFTFRSATADDSDEILEIYSPFISNTCVTFETEIPSEAEFRQRVTDIVSRFPYIVCECGGRIIGYAYASPFAQRNAYRYTVETSIYILPQYHRLGIGKKLYTRLFADLTNSGFHTACAVIALPNEASYGFHKALGFSEAGVLHEVGYKHGNWIDIVYLEKKL